MTTSDIRPPRIAPATSAAPGEIGHAALSRMLLEPHEPLLYADWDRALFIHYAVPAEILKPYVPFPLDLHEGTAYVSLLAFTMRDMRPRRGGRLAAWLFRPIASHGFLRHDWRGGEIAGRVTDPKSGAVYSYRALVDDDPAAYKPAAAGSLTEWLIERYTAFTAAGRRRRLFRVWHAPWAESPAAVKVLDDSLLREHWPWFAHARLVGANFSPGFHDVWMGRPHRVPEAA
jgi:uncharacterized protein